LQFIYAAPYLPGINIQAKIEFTQPDGGIMRLDFVVDPLVAAGADSKRA